MIGKGKYMQGNPIFLDNDNKQTNFQRIPLTDKVFQENWLQNLIDKNPEIFPIAEIEPFYSPLISIGREIETKAGFIDNLYINPDGYITLVETKLWRNAEARREVIGQILDYAKELTKYSFEELDVKIRKANKFSKGIIELIDERFPSEEIDKSNFIDQVTKNLKRGRFLLLIVGDGIRESVEDLVNYLNSVTQLDFTISMIELRIYKTQNNETLIIPNTLFRTIEIGRTIVTYEGTINEIKIQSEEQNSLIENKIVKQSKLNQEDFIQTLSKYVSIEDVKFISKLINDFQTDEFTCKFNIRSVNVYYSHPELKKPIALLHIYAPEGVYIASWLIDQLKNNNISELVGQNYLDNICKLLNIQVDKTKKLYDRKTTVENLRKNYEGFKNLVFEFKDEFLKELDK